jgi:hypothetical protein
MSKPLLIFQAPVGSQSGYGSHSRDIARAIISMDRFDVKIVNTLWGATPNSSLNETDPRDKIIIDHFLNEPLKRKPDIYIQNTVPNEYMAMGHYNIGITAGIETNVCSRELIEGINRMNLVITVSKHSKDVFQNTVYDKVNRATNQVEGSLSVSTPIEILFEGIDTEVFKKTNEISVVVKETLDKIKESFVFLFVGHWLPGDLGEDRKDVGMLIKTFIHTFKKSPDKPALLLKTSGVNNSAMDRDDILRKIDRVKKEFKDDTDFPNIYLLHGDLSDSEMNSVYNHPKVKAMVSFTKGEGFGRPLLEFSVSGKPIFVSSWSGLVDFLKPEYTTFLSGKLREIHSSAVYGIYLIPGSKWFSVDYNHATNVFRDMKRNYKFYIEKAWKQKNYSRDNFSLDKMKTELEKIFDKYLPKFSEEIPINLPQLKKIGD